MTRPRSVVLLNPRARGGEAARLWRAVEPHVSRHSRVHVVHADARGHWVDAIRGAASEGIRVFVAAGGDGTVNALLNALYDADALLGATVAPRAPRTAPAFTFGAVGLGSSNDFHKPVSRAHGSVPLRINPVEVGLRDVGIARYHDGGGNLRNRLFLVSASVGLTAEANAAFNEPGPICGWLKRRSTTAAIAYTAVASIVGYRSFPAVLRLAGEARAPMRVQITNLSVMKTPYLSGWLRFDTPVERDDGRFAINLSSGLTRRHTLGMLWELSRGRFLASRRPGIHHWRARELTVEAPHPFALELDGEVVRATRVAFDVLPDKLRCCT